MNLKRIIREEVDDFDWAKGSLEEPYVGFTFTLTIGDRETYTIRDYVYDDDGNIERFNTVNGPSISMKVWKELLKKDAVSIVESVDNKKIETRTSSIVEENDFDWTDEISPGEPYIGLVFKHKGDMTDENPDGYDYEVIDIVGGNIHVQWNDGHSGMDDIDTSLVSYKKWVDEGLLIFLSDINESNDFEWTKDIGDTTLGELFDNGELKTGDRVHVMGPTKQGKNDTDEVNINTVFTIGVVGSSFESIEVTTDDVETRYILGVDDPDGEEYFSLIKKDGDLMVVSHEKSIHESNDFDWANDIDYLESDCYMFNLTGRPPLKYRVKRLEGDKVVFHAHHSKESLPIPLDKIRGWIESGLFTPCEESVDEQKIETRTSSIVKENDFGWAEDVPPSLSVDVIPKEGYILIYWYPRISSDEYFEYVEPKLKDVVPVDNGEYRNGVIPGNHLDHTEIHLDRDVGGITGYSIVSGNVGYDQTSEEEFIESLDTEEQYNGRVIFDIPS